MTSFIVGMTPPFLLEGFRNLEEGLMVIDRFISQLFT